MLADVCVGELWRPSRVSSILIDGGSSGHTPRQPGWAVLSCRVLWRIETFYLHLSYTITANRSTRAFTCMHVASRIASSPNLVSCISTMVMVALKMRPILDESGSAFVAGWYLNGHSANMAVKISRYSRDSTSVIF